MTRNQIYYQQQVEQRRTNRKNEELTSLRDAETARSNAANEALTQARNEEQARSNLANEFIKYGQLTESARHNMNSERIQASQVAELSRSNLAREIETNRANMAMEAEAYRSHVAQETNQQVRNTNDFVLGQQNVQEQRYATNTRAETATQDRISRESISRRHETNENLRTLYRGVNETGNNVIRTIGGLGQTILRGFIGGH